MPPASFSIYNTPSGRLLLKPTGNINSGSDYQIPSKQTKRYIAEFPQLADYEDLLKRGGMDIHFVIRPIQPKNSDVIYYLTVPFHEEAIKNLSLAFTIDSTAPTVTPTLSTSNIVPTNTATSTQAPTNTPTPVLTSTYTPPPLIREDPSNDVVITQIGAFGESAYISGPVTIEQFLLGNSETHYRLEASIRNNLPQDVLIKHVSILAVKPSGYACYQTFPELTSIYEISDTLTISSILGSKKKLELTGSVVEKETPDFSYEVKGYFDDGVFCGDKELKFSKSRIEG